METNYSKVLPVQEVTQVGC